VGNVYTTTVQLTSGDIVVYRLYPYADLNVVDVGISGSSDISTKMFVSESVTVNGTVNEWLNYIRLKDISCSIGCGANTVLTSDVNVRGNTQALSASSILSLIGMLVNNAGYTTTSQILSAFSSTPFNDQNYVTTKSITTANTRAVGIKWSSSIVFNDSNDYLAGESLMASGNTSRTANLVTYAAGEWVFDVYYGAGSLYPEYSDVALRPSGTYKVNAR